GSLPARSRQARCVGKPRLLDLSRGREHRGQLEAQGRPPHASSGRAVSGVSAEIRKRRLPMTFDTHDLVAGTARWAAGTEPPAPAPPGEEALAAARRFLSELGADRQPPSPGPDILFASCELLSLETDSRLALPRSQELFAFLGQIEASPFREEVADLQ